MQAIAAAQQAAEEAESTADASVQQLSTQLQEQTAENGKLRAQLKKLNADLLDLRGQLEVQGTQQSMLEAREQQHQHHLQEQTAKMKEKAAELEAVAKELQVRQFRASVPPILSPWLLCPELFAHSSGLACTSWGEVAAGGCDHAPFTVQHTTGCMYVCVCACRLHRRSWTQVRSVHVSCTTATSVWRITYTTWKAARGRLCTRRSRCD